MVLINENFATNSSLHFNTLTLSVFEKIPCGTVIVDAKGNTIYANNVMEELLGYKADELIGRPHKEVVTLLLGKHHNYEDIQTEWQSLTSKETLHIKNIRKFTHKDGYAVPLEVEAHALLDQNKDFRGEVLFVKDLHEKLIYTVTKLVNSSLSLDEVLENTAKAVIEHLGLASNTVFLLNKDKGVLELVTCTVFPCKEEIQKVSFKIGEGIPGIVAATQRPKYIKNLRTEPRVSEQARKYHGDESSLVFPLICKNDFLGVISFTADTVRTFSDKEYKLFENITNQVATAIYNAQLFSRMEHLSTTDGLTGLYNHRYFQERLKNEIERSERTKTALSLLMIDVDNFKNYNDTFGHVQGDELLKQLAALIKQNVRNIDVVARYGGEEFAVVLINCDKDEALKIADRIKLSIEDYPFEGAEYQPKGKVTVSIGMATNAELFNRNQLLFYADKALYKAKKEGKNKIEFLAG